MVKSTLTTIYGLLFILCLLGTGNIFTAQAQNVAVVNAAHYFKDGGTGTTANSGIVTPEGIASAFGAFTITAGQPFYVATPGQALPKILGGVKVTIAGTDADLMVVAPNQINFVIPTNVPVGGIQTITVTNSNATTTTGLFRNESFAPGIFSGAGTGAGVAAANWIPPGTQNYLNTHKLVGNQWVHEDVSAGTVASPAYLILYATGVRRAPNTNTANDFPGLINVAESCKVTIQGVPAKIDYAGKHQFFVGLDQLNVIIPPEAAGLGIVTVRLEVKDSATGTTRMSNAVEIKLAGNLAPITIRKQLNLAGETVSGALAPGDDLEVDPAGNLYFIDVYSFTTTAPNTSVAIDLRMITGAADPLDTLILLRKNNTNNTQTFIASDDQGGAFDNGVLEKLGGNNNSLLFTVLPDPGEYWIFVTSADVPNGGIPLDTGPYSLTLYSSVITPIAYGQTANGNITSSSPIKTASGVYVNAFSFTGTENEAVQIKMTAPNFAAFEILRERNGDEIAIGDAGNNGVGLPAIINKTLPVKNTLPATRTFIIVTTPLQVNTTGTYTLQLTKTSALTGLEPTVSNEYQAPRRVSETDAAAERRRTVSSRVMYRRPVEKTQEQ